MPIVRAKIPLSYRLLLFIGLLITWLSGLGTYIFQEWVRVDTEFGPSYHPQQKNIRRVHGASAFFMMIVYGYLLASHIPAGWKQNRLRKSGLFLIIAQFIMIASGYFIYYFAKEEDRITDFIKDTHLIVGIMFPTMLIIHIICAIYSKPRPKKKP